MLSYEQFLERKMHLGGEYGFALATLPSFLFPFQAHLVEWALRKGRAAIFADTGLGKTAMQLVWADQVARHKNGRVLILTPLAVGAPTGLTSYAGARNIPTDVLSFRNWSGSQLENRYSHWIWRQYASAFWDDVRLDRVLPFRQARDEEDERHVHPLQLDVIERAVILWSNPGEPVLSPFMGVGSEVYGAVLNGRLGVGIELKESYYRQAVRNVEHAVLARKGDGEVALPFEDDLAGESHRLPKKLALRDGTL